VIVLVPDDQELLPVLHELGDVLAEKGEGGLVTTMSASFRNAMHSALRKSPPPYLSSPGCPCGLVLLEEELDVVDVRRAVSVLVFHLVEDLDGERLGLLALAIPLVVFRETR
jgi:hypothetical protein